MGDEFDPTDITPGPMSPYVAVFDKYRKLKPRVWRTVADLESKAGATQLLFRLRGRPDIVGPGIWEFAVQRMDGEASQLRVRYMGKSADTRISWWRAGKLVDKVPREESLAKSEAGKKAWAGADRGTGRMSTAEKKKARKRARG